MLNWALTFLIVAVVAGALGLTGVAGTAAGIAKVLFFIAIGLFLVTLIGGLMVGGSVSKRLSSKRHDDSHLTHR